MKAFIVLLSLSDTLSLSNTLKSTAHHQSKYLCRSKTPFRLHFNSLQHDAAQRITTTATALDMGKPKSGSIVENYRTVSVNCKKCRTRLFRYKKKNGTKSNLIKCYVERISEDCVNLVADKKRTTAETNEPLNSDWNCPNCGTLFGRDSMIHGRPAIKLIGGKTAMTKK